MAAPSDWSLFIDRYSKVIPDFDLFLKALENPFPIGLREGRFNSVPYTLQEKLEKKGEGFEKVVPSWDFFHVQGERKVWGGDIDHHHGLYFMQAFSSLLPSLSLLGNQEGEDLMVLDLCAAPGGKTTHLADLMNNRGLLCACEPDLFRRRVLKANLTRMGILNCAIVAGKGQDQNFFKESFDAILLDGPCSSEGTFRSDVISGAKRRKTNYLEYNTKFRKSLHKEQQALIDHAISLLKRGGSLVYSTCTYDPHENESVVQYALNQHKNMRLVELNLPKELALESGLSSFESEKYSEDMRLTARVYPHRINSIGFYVAKFTKL